MTMNRMHILAVATCAVLAAMPALGQQTVDKEERPEQGAGPAEVGPEEVETLIAAAPVTGPSVPTAVVSTGGIFALPASAEAYGPYSNIMPLAGGVPLDAGVPAGGQALPSLVRLAVLPFDATAPAPIPPVPVAVPVPAIVPAAAAPAPVVLTTSPDYIGPAQFPAPPPPNAYGPRGPAQTASGS